jgi:hypothetical protein
VATIKSIDGKWGTRYRAIIRKQGKNMSRMFNIISDAKKWADKTEIVRGHAGLIREGHKYKFSKAFARYKRQRLASKSAGTQRPNHAMSCFRYGYRFTMACFSA